MAEYLVKCIRADKMRIPVIGGVLGKAGKLPRFHIAIVSMVDVPGVKIDQEFFRGDDLHQAYDTRQIFRDWNRDPLMTGFKTEQYAGPFSYLSAWHVKGRHEQPQAKRSFFQRLFTAPPPPKPLPKPHHPLIAKVSRLSPDKAWHYARLLNLQGVI